jgi:hypothetical protein
VDAACHRLGAAPGAAPASHRRSALGVPRVTGSGQLQDQHMSRGLQHPPPGVGQLRGAPRVPTALGRRKNVGPSSSETELLMIFLAPTAQCRAALRGLRMSPRLRAK